MEQTAHFVLTVILIAALICDCVTYKIPNKLIVVGGAAGVLFRFMESSFAGIWYWLCGTVCMAGILYLLYHFSMMGAGDVKLFGVIGGFLGVRRGCILAGLSLFIAALIALLLMFTRHNFVSRMRYLLRYIQGVRSGKGIKYMDFEQKDRSACMHFTVPLLIADFILWGIEIFGKRF